MYHRLLSFGVALVLVLVASAHGQDERQLNATFKTGAVYVPGRWLATQLRCSNPTAADIRGSVSTSAESKAGPYELIHPIHVPPNSLVLGEMLTQVSAPPPSGRTEKPKPAATFFWRSAEGAELAREPIYAVADSASLGGGNEGTGVPGVSVLYIASEYAQIDSEDPSDLPSILGRDSTYRFTLNALEPARLSRRTLALDASRLIILDQTALSQIDPTQQQALLDHVSSGATLLVIAQDAAVSSTWVGPLLPLDLVGARESASLESTEFAPVKFNRVLAHHVAIARPGATVTASGRENTWAAYREVGFGRIAMIAFPINALDRDDATSAAIWTSLVGAKRSAFHDPIGLEANPASPGDSSLVGVLPSMVGATAPPWKTAAIISLAYTGVVAVALLFIGAKRRPVAIVACVAGGVVLAAGVLGLSKIKSSDEPLMLARLSVVDVSGDIARRDELITFFGEAPLSGIDYTVPDGAVASAIVATGKQPPRVTMFPFQVAGVSSSTGTFASVWQIRSVQRRSDPLRATLSFGPNGATLDVAAPAGTPIESPRLVFGASVMPLEKIEAGEKSVAVGSRNAPGDYSGGGGVISDEQSKLRTEIVTRLESRVDPILGRMRRSLEPRLIGFTSESDSGIETSVVVDRRDQTLVRATVDMRPTPVGTSVRIDPGFTQIRRDAAISLPYRAEADAWTEASQGGPWLVAIAAPAEIGKLNPTTLKLDLDLRATGYDFTVQRGQVTGGKVRESASAEVVLQWNNTDAARQATIELTPSDIDENGWVWLRISATQASGESLIGSLGGGTGTLPNWRMLRFDATLSGTVVAPPQPIITTWSTEPPSAPAKPSPKPAAKPAPKPKKQ